MAYIVYHVQKLVLKPTSTENDYLHKLLVYCLERFNDNEEYHDVVGYQGVVGNEKEK